MRVLFIHAASNGRPPEYKVHTTLAGHAPAKSVESYFVWQSPEFSSPSVPADRVLFHDFGRDMSVTPKPGRARRAVMVGRRLPGSIAFLKQVMRSVKPDLIYTSQQQSDVFHARLMSRLFNVPHALHLHYNVGPWLGASTLRAILHSTNLIAVSEYIRQTALLRGVNPADVHTVLNPMPDSDETLTVERDRARAEFGYSPSTPLVVSVGRLDPGKGHVVLFEAFAEVARQLPNARLLVCGKPSFESSYGQQLDEKLKELRLENHVTLAGYRHDIKSLMQCADVFCLPTEMEPSGLVFLEAGAAGLPSVAYYSGGVPEIVRDRRTGLLSYPHDTEALAANLLLLLTNGDQARRLGTAARELVSSDFDAEKIARRWATLLQKFAKSRT